MLISLIFKWIFLTLIYVFLNTINNLLYFKYLLKHIFKNTFNKGNEGQNPVPISQVEKLVGKPVTFYNVDLLDYDSLSKVFDKVSYMVYYINL